MTDSEAGRAGALHFLLAADAGALAACRAFSAPGDAVVLAGAGVLAMARADWSSEFEAGIRLVCLRADAAAQGLIAEAEAQSLRLLDESELVGLVVEYPHCLTWT